MVNFVVPVTVYFSRTVIGIFLSVVSSVIGNNYGPRGVLNIYMRKLEIPVGKSNGVRYSVWEASQKILAVI